MRMRHKLVQFGAPIFILFLYVLLAACTPNKKSVVDVSANICPVTEAVWAKPPEDSAVVGSSEYGYYFVSQLPPAEPVACT